jgi:hypothetical protein
MARFMVHNLAQIMIQVIINAVTIKPIKKMFVLAVADSLTLPQQDVYNER